jgi:hypothetical protein
MADTTRVVRIVVDASGAQQGSSQVTSALERIDRQRQRTQSGLEALAAANASASARMIAGMSAVNNASLRMIEGMSRAGQAAAAMNQSMSGLAVAQQRYNTMAASGGRAFGGLGLVMQQAGFQVGDFAVQVASGQGALRAFIQQGTQLLGFFGPWGAVIGAAAAVVGGLAMAFFDLEDATDDATRAQERYAEAQETAKRLMEETGRLSDIKQKSLEAEKIRLLEAARAEVQRAQAAIQARKELLQLDAETALSDPLVNPGMEISSRYAAITDDARLRELEEAARAAQQQFSILNAELGMYADGRSRITETTDAIASSVEKAEKKVRTFADVLADLNQKAVVQEAKEYADAIKLIEQTIQSGLTDQERYEQQVLAINRALEIAAERGWQLSAENAERLNRALKEADPAFRAAKEAAEKAQSERERMAEREAEVMRKPFENALEGIQDSFTDFFEDVFDGGIDSFRDLASGIKGIFVRLAAELAALMVIRPMLAGIGLGGMVGGAGSIGLGGGVGGSAGGMGGGIFDAVGGIGRALAGGVGGINSFLFGSAAVAGDSTLGGIAATSGLLGTGGTLLGSTFLANAFLPGLGAMLPGLIGGNIGQAGLGLGGALLGTAIGGPIGGAIGGILGNLVGDLFGGKKGIPQVTQNLLFQGGQLVPGAPWSANNGGSMVAGTRTLGQSVADAVNQIVADLGGSILEGATGGYVKVKQTGKGTRYFAGLGSYGSGISLGAGDDPQAIAGLVISGILQEAARAGNLTGVSDSVLTVLNQGKVTKGSVRSLEQLNEDIAFAQLYDQLTGIAKPVTQAEQAIKELNKQFADAKRRAEDLGLAVGPLVEAQAKAIEKLTTDFNASIQDQILAITNPTALALKQLEEAQRARLEEAKKLGADLVAIEKLSALERQRVLEQAGGGLRSFFDEITFGGLSGASPGASLEGSRAAFEAAAASGNIQDIQTYGRAYLESARAFYASGSGFQDALSRVQGVVGGHLTANDNTAVVGAVNNVSSLISASNNLLADLRAEMAALREENRELREQMLALAVA